MFGVTNIVLFLAFLALGFSGLVLWVGASQGVASPDVLALGLARAAWQELHRYASFLAVGAGLIHAARHPHLLKTAGSIFTRRLTIRGRLRKVLRLTMLILGVAVFMSGFMPTAVGGTWRVSHCWVGVGLAVLTGMHLWLNRRWIAALLSPKPLPDLLRQLPGPDPEAGLVQAEDLPVAHNHPAVHDGVTHLPAAPSRRASAPRSCRRLA